MAEPTKADLVSMIMQEIDSNMYEYRHFIIECLERELSRWKK